jgi:hypothetical protein
MSAVEQLEGWVIRPHARPVGQYGQLAAVADQEVLRGVVGHPPAGADEAALYLSLVRWLPPFPKPFVPGSVMIAKQGAKLLGIPCNIVVAPGGAFRISGLVQHALPCPRSSIVEPGMGKPVRQMAFSFLDVVDEVAEMGAAPADGYGAGRGEDQLLAAVALEGDIRRMPLVDLAERDFVGLVTRFDSFDDVRHRLVPSCRPAHPKWKGYERQRDVLVTLVTIPHPGCRTATDCRQT